MHAREHGTHVRAGEGGRGRTEVSFLPKGKKRGFGRLVISAQGVVRRLDILPDTGVQVEPEED